MFHLGRCARARLLLCLSCLLAPPSPAALADNSFAQQQIRYIATYFPGRMAGSPAELMAAEYLQHGFAQWGYKSNLRAFNTRYLFQSGNGGDWRKITATSVIAAKGGTGAGEVLVIARLDTFTPRSDKDINNNLGGLTLQGVDDNASGLGVMLGLAQRLSQEPLSVGVRFVAISDAAPQTLGAEEYLQRMSAQERSNTLLVINLTDLIAGEKLRLDYSPDGGDARLQGLVKALGDQARRQGIPLAIHAGIRTSAECATDALPFAKAGFAVMDVSSGTAADGCQQRKPSRHFPQGTLRSQSQRDNLAYLDAHLTGQIAKRARDSQNLLQPLLRQLTQGR